MAETTNIRIFAERYLSIDTTKVKRFPIYQFPNGKLYQILDINELVNPELRKLETSQALYLIQALYYFWGQLDSE